MSRPHRPDPTGLDAPMATPTDAMPEDERKLRAFLGRYRPPGGAAHWTEAQLVDCLRRARAKIAEARGA